MLEVDFLVCPEMGKRIQSRVFLCFHKILSILFAKKDLRLPKLPKMKGLTIICFSVQTPYPGKFCFTSYGPTKCSRKIGLHDPLIINICGGKALVFLIFCFLH